MKIDSKFVLSVILLLPAFAVSAWYFPIGVILISLILLCIIKIKKFGFLLVFLVLLLFWQNTWIGFVSDLISEKQTFNLIHAINFIISFLIFIYVVSTIRRIGKEYYNLWIHTLLVLIMLLIALILGIGLYGLENAIVYFRLFSTPLVLFWVGFWLGGHSYDNPRNIFVVLLKISLSVVILEFIFPSIVIRLLNDQSYFNWKLGLSEPTDVVDYFKSNSTLPYGITIPRVAGMIKSIVSNSYFLIILGLILYWEKSKKICWLIVLIVSICCASKGAILLFMNFAFVMFARKYFSISIITGGLILIWTSIVVIGSLNQNEHIVGFLSGTKYILSTGNALGFAGNLSDVRLTSWNGPPLKDLGYWTRFQNGSESAFGVLFSSLGLFSLLYLFLNFQLLRIIHRKFQHLGLEHLSVLCMLVFMQGIFQEEALSPYVYGLTLLIAGFSLRSDKKIG